MKDTIQIPIQSVMEELTIEIGLRVSKSFTWRMWIAAKVFKFGGWVAGCKIELIDVK